MLPSSIVVIVATALFTAGAALLLFIVWRQGWLSDLDAQSRVIFEARDFVLDRPWEDGAAKHDRRSAFGPLEKPAAGEWGGAT